MAMLRGWLIRCSVQYGVALIGRTIPLVSRVHAFDSMVGAQCVRDKRDYSNDDQWLNGLI